MTQPPHFGFRFNHHFLDDGFKRLDFLHQPYESLIQVMAPHRIGKREPKKSRPRSKKRSMIAIRHPGSSAFG
jgi:hypothetical protein